MNSANRRSPSYTTVALTTALSSVLFGLVAAAAAGRLNWVGGAITVALASIASFYIVIALQTLRETPRPLSVVLLGLPAAGKTTYLAALLNQMQRTDAPGTRFVPYTRSTLEWLGEAVSTLTRGDLLPRTQMWSARDYVFKVDVTIDQPRRRYALEITDAAGEYTYSFAERREWLHQDAFFNRAVAADCLMLAIDVAALTGSEPAGAYDAQAQIATAMQVMFDAKNVRFDKIREPVAVLLLKDDLVNGEQRDKALASLSVLRDVLRKRCENVEYFFVSSMRALQPTVTATPEAGNVLPPLVWALKHVSRPSGTVLPSHAAPDGSQSAG